MEPLQMNGKMVPELPENWVWTTIRDIVTFEYGKALRKDRRDSDGSTPVYGSNGIVGYHSIPLTNAACLIVGRKGAAGNVHISKVPCWPIDTTYYIASPSSVSLFFLYFLLSTLNLNSLDKSTAIPGLNRNDAYILNIPLPPLPEQHRIVTKIEEIFVRLDTGVGALTKAKAQLKRYRQSVLKSACEGKLVPTEAELARAEGRDYEPADVLLARIREERREKWEAEKKRKGKKSAKYKEPAVPDANDLPELPEGWCYTLLNPLVTTTRSGMKTGPFGSLLKKHEHRSEGIPVLGIENIAAMKFILGSKIHVTEEKAHQLSGYDAQPRDILISRSGTVGEVCVVPEGIGEARISTNLMRVVLVSKGMLSFFFCFLPKFKRCPKNQ